MRMTKCSSKQILWAVLTTVLTLSYASAAESRGWFKAGSHPNDYDMGTDLNIAFTGKSSGYLKNKKPEPEGFGTYMQMFDAAEYQGKRLRLSCFVQSENVEEWAGVWMRVDRDKKSTAFDNMQNRPIKGTQSWTRHEIVLNVDPKATAIAFGILLRGKGAAWIDDVSFEVVSDQVPVTDMHIRPETPHNLDFETETKKP
jgi:hypothetical protein